MATFDVSIKANHVEVQNALAQVKKEIANRFDFKGTCAEVTNSDSEIISKLLFTQLKILVCCMTCFDFILEYFFLVVSSCLIIY